MTSADVLFTVKEYADLFRVTPTAVYSAIRRGKLPHAIDRPLGDDGAIRIRVPSELVATLRAA